MEEYSIVLHVIFLICAYTSTPLCLYHCYFCRIVTTKDNTFYYFIPLVAAALFQFSHCEDIRLVIWCATSSLNLLFFYERGNGTAGGRRILKSPYFRSKKFECEYISFARRKVIRP